MRELSQERNIEVHGGMKYRCTSCGYEVFMCLEVGVEDHGKNGRPHQPCPFIIGCQQCNGHMQDVSGYLPLPGIRLLFPGMHVFLFDPSGKEDACGIATYYNPNKTCQG